jgi:hypothetical protein
MKMYTGLVGGLHTFSASALVGHEWPAHGPGTLPTKKLLLISMGLKVVWSPQHVWMRWQKKNSYPCHEWNPSQPFYRERVSDQEKCLQQLTNEAIWTYSTHLLIAKYNHHQWTFMHYTQAWSIRQFQRSQIKLEIRVTKKHYITFFTFAPCTLLYLFYSKPTHALFLTHTHVFTFKTLKLLKMFFKTHY